MDKGYDSEPIHPGCMDRGAVPVTALRTTPAFVRGDHKPPSCERWDWTFAGADFKRKAYEVAMPYERVPACVRVGQDRPPAPPGSAHNGAESEAVLLARRARTRVWTAQA
jgi:hypothetical protein